MKKNLLKAAALVAMLVVSGATAHAAKKYLYQQDYTGATTALGWTGNYTTFSIADQDPFTDCVSIVSSRGSGYTGGGYTAFSDAAFEYGDVANYIVEFDAKLNQAANIALMDENTDKSMGKRTEWGFENGAAGNATNNLFYWKNDAVQADGAAVTFDDNTWYHFKFAIEVATRTVSYTISAEGKDDVTGSYVSTGTSAYCKGIYLRTVKGKTSYVDNIAIYYEIEGDVANNPSIMLTGLNGTSRTYTLSFSAGETLHYTMPGETEEKTSTEAPSIKVTTSTSGTLSAYTTSGTATSETISETVEAVEVELPAATYTMAGVVEGWEKSFTIRVDNSNVLLKPEISLMASYPTTSGQVSEPIASGDVITATAYGTITVTASAAGYTSSQLVIENDKRMLLVKEMNFDEMTAEDFSEDLWESAQGGELRANWTSNASAIPEDATYFKLKEANAENIPTAIPGLTIATNRQPYVFIGYGLYTPYNSLSGSGNYMNFTINDAPEGGYAVYSGWSSYGASEFTTTQEATANYGLYRYDTMLRNIKIYAPEVIEEDPIDLDPANVKLTWVAAEQEFKNGEDVNGVELALDDHITAVFAGKNDPQVNNAELKYANAGKAVRMYGNNTLTLKGTDILKVVLTYTKGGDAMKVDGQEVTYDADKLTTTWRGEAANQVVFTNTTTETSDTRVSEIYVVYVGTTVGISELTTVGTTNATVYNLQGQKVAQPARGLYIVNGRKVVLK